jgi:hypothetical protein
VSLLETVEPAALAAAEGVVKGELVALGVSNAGAAFLWKLLVSAAELVESEFSGGGDAQRKAMFDAADATVDEAEKAKFGGG